MDSDIEFDQAYGFDRYTNNSEDDDEINNDVQDVEGSTNESTCSNVNITPNGTTTWVPNIPMNLQINIGAQFENLSAAITAYERYAEASGFTIRLSSTKLYNDRSIRKKYLICSKSGTASKQFVDSLNAQGLERRKRNSSFKVTDCKALIILYRHYSSKSFIVEHIQEAHNHPLIKSDSLIMCTKKRQLKFTDKQFVVQAASTGIGPTKAHKIYAASKGGYDNIATRSVDFTNFWRDFTKHVGVTDAQCIVNEMNTRKANFPNYTFEHKLDGHELCAMFWADDVAKANYKEFNDVISFDATYRQNKYDMIFIPFTAVDHHKKTVNVGAAVLAHETIENYIWVLKAFLDAHGKEPRMVLSDQDPAMKQAISQIFPKSTHRLCMWHIMQKMRTKISPVLVKNIDFTRRINKLIWNVFLEPYEFEVGWTSLMREYDLTDHIWLKSMYEIRDSWIPAYFKHIPNCCLMKTTSRSESSNSFFNTFSRHGNLFVNFMMNFDTAIEKQRIDQRALDELSRDTEPSLLTDADVEVHAAKVYTRSVFLEVQKEIKKAMSKCYQVQCFEFDGGEICNIAYKSKTTGSRTIHKVEYKREGSFFKCSCDHFMRFGLLCCHIFRVILNYDIQEIPSQYVLRRWQKNVISKEHQRTRHGWVQKDNQTTEMVREVHFITDHCIDKYVSDTDKFKEFIDKLRLLKAECDEHFSNINLKRTKEQTFETLLGVSIPETIDIHVPSRIRNKGRPTTKRLVGAAEKAQKSSKKTARTCGGCGKQVVGHNWRTCPVRKAKE